MSQALFRPGRVEVISDVALEPVNGSAKTSPVVPKLTCENAASTLLPTAANLIVCGDPLPWLGAVTLVQFVPFHLAAKVFDVFPAICSTHPAYKLVPSVAVDGPNAQPLAVLLLRALEPRGVQDVPFQREQ